MLHVGYKTVGVGRQISFAEFPWNGHLHVLGVRILWLPYWNKKWKLQAVEWKSYQMIWLASDPLLSSNFTCPDVCSVLAYVIHLTLCKMHRCAIHRYITDISNRIIKETVLCLWPSAWFHQKVNRCIYYIWWYLFMYQGIHRPTFTKHCSCTLLTFVFLFEKNWYARLEKFNLIPIR